MIVTAQFPCASQITGPRCYNNVSPWQSNGKCNGLRLHPKKVNSIHAKGAFLLKTEKSETNEHDNLLALTPESKQLWSRILWPKSSPKHPLGVWDLGGREFDFSSHFPTHTSHANLHHHIDCLRFIANNHPLDSIPNVQEKSAPLLHYSWLIQNNITGLFRNLSLWGVIRYDRLGAFPMVYLIRNAERLEENKRLPLYCLNWVDDVL